VTTLRPHWVAGPAADSLRVVLASPPRQSSQSRPNPSASTPTARTKAKRDPARVGSRTFVVINHWDPRDGTTLDETKNRKANVAAGAHGDPPLKLHARAAPTASSDGEYPTTVSQLQARQGLLQVRSELKFEGKDTDGRGAPVPAWPAR